MNAAFFDLDKTIIDRASVAAFGPTFRRNGMVNRRTVARAVASHLVFLYLGAGESRAAKMREGLLRVTRGWERDRVGELVREALLETVEPIIYGEALALMEDHRRAGDRIYLVSASPEEIVLPLADLLGADGAISSRGEVDELGRFTGELTFYAYGTHKASAIRDLAADTGIDLAASTAYSDSITDLPMLEAVGHPVAVNPDRALARMARERDWPIRHFTKPTRLRHRVSRTPVLTSGLALAGAAVLFWRRGQRDAGPPGPGHSAPGAAA